MIEKMRLGIYEEILWTEVFWTGEISKIFGSLGYWIEEWFEKERLILF